MAEPMDFLDRNQGTWKERLAFIVETMKEVSRHTDPEEMVRAYSTRMRSMRGDRLVSLSRRGVEPPRFVVARDSARSEAINPWTDRDRLPVLEGGLLGRIVYSNEAHLLDPLDVPDDDPAAGLLRGYRSLVALPVFDGGVALNVVLFLRRGGPPFDPEDLPQLVWTSNLFGRATHNLVLSSQVKRAYEMVDRELEDIAGIQRSLLPPALPRIPTLDLAVHYRPARRAGGDYYDVLPLPGDRWGFLVADVSGHGAPAAVEMAITRTLAHLRTAETAAPGSVLGYLNEHLVRRFRARHPGFVTAFFGAYEPAARELVWAAAGHPPPRLKRCSDGSLFTLDAPPAPPLGVVSDVSFGEVRRPLLPGDQMVLYTDGISEARDAEGAMFGTARLDAVLEHCGVDAQALIASVLANLEAFTGGREPGDDLTLLVARVV